MGSDNLPFNGPATFDQYMDLKFHLEAVLKRNVDLVTDRAVRPAMRPLIERELCRVA